MSLMHHFLGLMACGLAVGGMGLGTQLRAQTPGDAGATLPVGQLAFVTSADFGRSGPVFVMKKNFRIQTLSHQTRAVEFLADGKGFVYSANDPAAAGIFLHDLTNSTNTLLRDDVESGAEPCLSPDGQWLAYVRGEGDSSQIMVARMDGTEAKQLTAGDYFNWTPRWSPDGKVLLFETTRNETPATSGGGGQRDIYAMDPDGKNQTNLTPNSYGHHASWSPDGSMIAYMNDGAIFTMKRDGSGKRNVSQGKIRDSEPVWSPDGQWIAFTRSTKDAAGVASMDLWLMRSDGSEQRPLTKNEGKATSYSPSWGRE